MSVLRNCLWPFLQLALLLLFHVSFAQPGRTVKDISNNNWKLVLDKEATWINDELFAPPVKLKNLKINLPTGGWSALEKKQGVITKVPATVEQYYWGENGNSYGVAGNYLGVSWFTTTEEVPVAFRNKRILLHFESIRFRAEVFVNKKLVGYDLVNGTPFDVDITDAVILGKSNEIAVRITDPNGNFDWRDSQNFMWGSYRTNPTHGFGGITGRVKLVATDKFYVEDIFVKNKPKANEVDVQVTTINQSRAKTGSLLIQVKEAKGDQKVVFEKTYSYPNLAKGRSSNTYTITVSDAKLWSPNNPDLYTIVAKVSGADKSEDEYQQRFGFRWFQVRDINGDKQFYLNGKRFFALTSISWGFWPVNGIAPSDELARKQIETAKRIGLNMLNFHRTIGQQNVLDYADELGLLYFEEPGGNQYPADRFNAKDPLGKKQADFYFAARNEKLFRMIRRDRNHPSLVIYNMHNERGAQPQKQDSLQMLAAHKLDETRIITYNSSNGDIKIGPDPRFKLHLMPYDFTFKDYGWFDQHHAGGPGTYHDNLYKGPKDFLRYFDHKDEIQYWGEEGAIGTPPRLQLIREEILKTGAKIGWETSDYLKWYDAYDNFLKTNPGFRKAFSNVDSLTRSMGNVAYYYQGRVIENVRISNQTDGYAINGWESMKLENHSGIVDNYRNAKGDPELISRYMKPLYVAVKMNRKVLEVKDTSVVDFHIVNEAGISGNYDLEISLVAPDGKVFNRRTIPVKITGGVTYGELLSPGFMVVPQSAGYTTVKAVLKNKDQVLAEGDDKLFAVALNREGIPATGMVADTSGVVASFLNSVNVRSFKEFKSGRPSGKYLVVGAFEPQQTGNPLVTEILEWVNEGNTLIVIANIEKWAAFLNRKEIVDYRGSRELRSTWYGGNYFVKEHELFKGLPQNCVFNWEYQSLATYNKARLGLKIENGVTVVACVADHKAEVYSALSILPHGRGKIILSSLDIMSTIKDVNVGKRAEGDGENAAMTTFNNSSKNKANIVAQQLLLNMIKFANQ
ncbi:glycoside hydrolase family 2 protein [Desertivirga arenae]|uniref:glycoside hydrolase family 2 protein n=1 Tax=Desertivirga arenae TaxID=2810309 RepID=UPI001A96D2D3|nr:glycoside hydrolase family 2 TIM barrel-domain containing protein [Pedobacter sp. SYSU D00823]